MWPIYPSEISYVKFQCKSILKTVVRIITISVKVNHFVRLSKTIPLQLLTGIHLEDLKSK